MVGKVVKVALVVSMMLFPFVICAADDFEDDFDAEKSAAEKEKQNKAESDQAIKDLLGDSPSTAEEDKGTIEEDEADEGEEEEKGEEEEEEEETPSPTKKAETEKKKESVEDLLGTKKKEEKKPAPKPASGIKPVAMVKGSFNFGSYAKNFKQGLMYGAVDEGILGAEFRGNAIFAKATINVRTNNPTLLAANDGSAVQYNPLMDDNYWVNSIVNGMPYEVYGGMKLFDMVTLRAGKMIPAYSILDKYQHLGVAIGTPYGTRPLLAVEGFIPETDAGVALGFDYDFGDDSGIVAELMMGTGVIPSISSFWHSQKTMGMYFKGGYRSEMITALLGFQYRTDYDGTAKKQVPIIGFGLGAIFSYAGFETWLTFDYTMMGLLYESVSGAMKNGSVGGMNLSLMPAYNLSIDYGFIDKLQFGVRFDLDLGVYNKEAADGTYLTWYTGTGVNKLYYFKPDAMAMRFGFGINLFAKELDSVKSFFGISFLMQPQSQIINKTGSGSDVFNYGFYNFGIQGGAEF